MKTHIEAWPGHAHNPHLTTVCCCWLYSDLFWSCPILECAGRWGAAALYHWLPRISVFRNFCKEVLGCLPWDSFLTFPCSSLPSISGHWPLWTSLLAPFVAGFLLGSWHGTLTRDQKVGEREKLGISPSLICPQFWQWLLLTHDTTSHQAGQPWASFCPTSDPVSLGPSSVPPTASC